MPGINKNVLYVYKINLQSTKQRTFDLDVEGETNKENIKFQQTRKIEALLSQNQMKKSL